MKIRQAEIQDIEKLVEIDKNSYGSYGANAEYFKERIELFPEGVLVVLNNKNAITGFVVFEILDKNEIPKDFSAPKITPPIKGKWLHIIAFTTETNYKDAKADSELLAAAEKIAKVFGCSESFVPLSKNHPFEKNGVFDFWKTNGYSLAGEIKWVPNAGDVIECFFYGKKFF